MSFSVTHSCLLRQPSVAQSSKTQGLLGSRYFLKVIKQSRNLNIDNSPKECIDEWNISVQEKLLVGDRLANDINIMGLLVAMCSQGFNVQSSTVNTTLYLLIYLHHTPVGSNNPCDFKVTANFCRFI